MPAPKPVPDRPPKQPAAVCAPMILFTVLLAFSDPGHMAGQMKVCIQAEDRTAAAKLGLEAARRQLRPGRAPVVLGVVADGCPWMPNDLGDP